MDVAKVCALKMRFSDSFTDMRQIVHRLPNGLVVLTFCPDFAQTVHTISGLPETDKRLFRGALYCMVNHTPLELPIDCTVIDANPDPFASLDRMAAGPTGSYLLIVKPTRFKLRLPQSFVPLCNPL
jgi:hypothetical protein